MRRKVTFRMRRVIVDTSTAVQSTAITAAEIVAQAGRAKTAATATAAVLATTTAPHSRSILVWPARMKRRQMCPDILRRKKQ